MSVDVRKPLIVNILNEVYGKTKFTVYVNEQLADKLMDGYDNGREYSWGVYQQTRNEFINLIWMNYSGGSTAEYAGNLIIETLGLIFDKEDIKYGEESV